MPTLGRKSMDWSENQVKICLTYNTVYSWLNVNWELLVLFFVSAPEMWSS